MEKQEMNEVLENVNYESNVDELAYQLTAYQNDTYGYINYYGGIADLVARPYLDDLSDDEVVSYFNEYCNDKEYYDDILYSFDESFFEDYFSSPIEAARATYFGNIDSWNDDYIKFNGNGNLESLSSYLAKHNILDDNDFIQWFYENNEVFEDMRDEDFKDSIIDMVIKLVKQGY